LTYERKVTTARTPVGEALRLGRGVCQDFAHLFLGACRGIGLPARYVSGYVHQPGEVATHAWCQVWLDNAGWIDVDPTRGVFPENDYVTIAIGRDYSDVAPNRGVWKGQADETIKVKVKVEPIDRVPLDWSDWSVTEAPWSVASWMHSNPRMPRGRMSTQAGYRQQQGQQQQSR
jgi:transglutaminase-like putative cysteine protease